MSRSSLEQSADVRFALRNSLAALGEYGPLVHHLRAAEATAQSLVDCLRLGWISAYRTNELFARGENEAALAASERATALASAAGDLPLQVTASLFLGQVCHTVGQYRRGAQLLRQNIAALETEALAPRHESRARDLFAHLSGLG